jgi:hypothetical protein
MAANKPTRSAGPKLGRGSTRRKSIVRTARAGNRSLAGRTFAALEEARRAGLLDGEKTEHMSFRAPRALVTAAKRVSGINSATELGILALATVAQPDPVAAFFKRTRGRLGRAHTLEY